MDGRLRKVGGQNQERRACRMKEKRGKLQEVLADGGRQGVREWKGAIFEIIPPPRGVRDATQQESMGGSGSRKRRCGRWTFMTSDWNILFNSSFITHLKKDIWFVNKAGILLISIHDWWSTAIMKALWSGVACYHLLAQRWVTCHNTSSAQFQYLKNDFEKCINVVYTKISYATRGQNRKNFRHHFATMFVFTVKLNRLF